MTVSRSPNIWASGQLLELQRPLAAFLKRAQIRRALILPTSIRRWELESDSSISKLKIPRTRDESRSSSIVRQPLEKPSLPTRALRMLRLSNSDIGNKINTQVIQPPNDANSCLARSDFPDFNDSNKLADGANKVKKLGNLIAIFENTALDFSKNHAENDNILGDAYEYLTRHFVTESGKSKGQFYTPSEVSRIMAKAIGISPANTKVFTTAYDPACGSGSLLLKVAADTGKQPG